ncbi:MAG TPA: TrpB-like pyridoxal phosphate-dependent enzyme [Chloroflexota bacterium]|nr:TrpB-like pyridoxal phosphate-dependent enzyme [Chloroflexota bacterium]HEX2987035.1 TrpB-like pyridoxal phosphate-dependent enzyme [Chloroflexota bacterium]
MISASERTTKILLDESEMPTHYYNVAADLPKPLDPPLHPATGKPLGPEDLAPLFPMELIRQEVSTERYIEIPEEVQDVYRLWRPSPLIRARNLEKALDTPAKIYYKYEGASPAGSHKLNTSVAQAYYNKKEGIKRLSTETGAGQWGSALSMACSFFGLECKVYMVKVSYFQKPYRRSLIETFGASVVPSPSPDTAAGRAILAKNPDSRGSLGIAISEAVEDAVSREDTHYSLGSVLNHVVLHQTVIGQEAKAQLAKVDEYPDIVIGCVGGGSNFGGIAFPFMQDRLAGRKLQFIAVEPAACPTLTKGVFAYDYGDTAKLAPVAKMYTLGHDFMPEGIHAGGLRYHGMSPLISALYDQGYIDAVALPQLGVFDAAVKFARLEGLVVAPESAHAVKAAMDAALRCKESGEAKTILFNLSGHGNFDMAAYDAYFAGKLQDYDYPEEKVQEALSDLPKVD